MPSPRDSVSVLALAAADSDAARDSIRELLTEAGIILDNGSLGIVSAVTDIITRARRDPRITLTREQCMLEGGWARTSQIQKEETGKLRSYLDGSRRRITAQSFYVHLLALASAPYSKARDAAWLKKPPRARTENELRGLTIGNRRRHEAAVARRQAKAAPP
jgi:hypothetical protein